MKQIVFSFFLTVLLTIFLSSVCFASAPYRLMVKDGMLAVWDCRNQIWREITDTPAATLPAADRFLLQNGISCTEQELQILLEDYDS